MTNELARPLYTLASTTEEDSYISSPSDPDAASDSPQLLIGDSLVPIQERKHAKTTIVTIDGLLKEPLFLKEDLKEGCGGQLWPAGLLLSKYMLEEHATDLVDQEPMLQLMQSNTKLNNLSSQVKPAILDWALPPSDDIPKHPAVVLAADCIYFEPAFPLLISTLQRLLGHQTVCYFCYKRRRRADLRCMKMIKKAFSVKEIPSFSNCDGYNRIVST